MKTLLRWAARIGAGLLVLFVVAVGAVYGLSEIGLRARYPEARTPLSIPSTPDLAPQGARIATALGCTDCHGATLRGLLFHDEWPIGRFRGPNLALLIPGYSDAQLEQLLRHGVRPGGRSLMIMPTGMHSTLDDREMAALIAYLRSVPRGGSPQPGQEYGPVGRLGFLLGIFPNSVQVRERAVARPLPDLGPPFERGRRLARSCTECHASDLAGDPQFPSPDLSIAASYELADFERLLRTGVASQDRRLPMMSPTAVVRFSHWSHDDIAALHAYLTERVNRRPVR